MHVVAQWGVKLQAIYLTIRQQAQDIVYILPLNSGTFDEQLPQMQIHMYKYMYMYKQMYAK